VAFGWSVDLSSEEDKKVSSSIGDIVNTSKAIAEAADASTRELVPRNAYDAVAKKIDENLHWTMLPLQDVAANPAVQQIVTSSKVFGDSPAITGIMHPYQADRLSPAQRKELLGKFGVDAVVIANVKIKVGGTSGFAVAGFDLAGGGVRRGPTRRQITGPLGCCGRPPSRGCRCRRCSHRQRTVSVGRYLPSGGA
jgi:hypothetical protein